MKAIVKVTLRKGVLDPQGKAIESALHHLGLKSRRCSSKESSLKSMFQKGTSDERVKEMCQKTFGQSGNGRF